MSGSEDFDDYADNIGTASGWDVADTWQEALARYHDLCRLSEQNA